MAEVLVSVRVVPAGVERRVGRVAGAVDDERRAVLPPTPALVDARLVSVNGNGRVADSHGLGFMSHGWPLWSGSESGFGFGLVDGTGSCFDGSTTFLSAYADASAIDSTNVTYLHDAAVVETQLSTRAIAMDGAPEVVPDVV